MQHKKLNNKFIMSTPSVRTRPIRTVQVQMGSMAHPMSEPPYGAPEHLSGASGSQGDPERSRAEENKGLTTEALAAHGGDSFSHLHRRVAASVSRSNCPASSSTAIEGPEEYEELRKKMDEYILHEEYYKSIRGEDGEEPLAVHGSRPRTDLGSYAHSGPPSTASLPRRPRPEYPRPCYPTPRAPEVGPTRVEEQHHPRPTYGALDHTAELLAKLLSGSEDPDVTALSEAIKAKLGIAEPLPKPELPSLSPGLSTLAEDLKRSRVSRLLPKVACPSPFHPRARTVPMADLQDVPVTEIERRGLSALAPLAGVSPSGLTPGGGKTGRPIAQANIQLEVPEFDPKNLPEWAEEFADFLLLTGQSDVDVATKCSLLKRSCKKKILQKKVKQIVKTCSTWAEVLLRLEKTFPVYETDLSVRTQIEELPMLPEFPSAARISEYVCDLEYLFLRMNVGSYGATEPHLWLMSKIPQRTWDDCRSTSERKSRTHSYDELVDLLIELALERENDSHMEKFLKKHLGRGGTPTPERGEGKGHKNTTNTNQGGGKGRGNLRAMNEVKPDVGTPPLFYCRPVNDKGGTLSFL